MSMFITNQNSTELLIKLLQAQKNIEEIYKKIKNLSLLRLNLENFTFSPILLHGNTINETDTTRVSMNCRFKSLLSPYNVFSTTTEIFLIFLNR